MNRNQVIELFKLIKNVYPTFEVSTEKVNSWTRMMYRMDFERVMTKAEQHALENKFPPTISEIAAYAPEENKHLEKIKKWEREASKVPQEVKENFRRHMEQLFKDKAND
ncbi:replicative helicase loader/inhibitor [Oceanobacillus caeni]|uniref:replicative helicase loader/inhibitor n=1 Tax=Oceanobacillus caeni TaxID=405946 RepID=UPI000760F678|nr:replicative helicase loader/inhibitor [Oceanobacillus caeni]